MIPTPRKNGENGQKCWCRLLFDKGGKKKQATTKKDYYSIILYTLCIVILSWDKWFFFGWDFAIHKPFQSQAMFFFVSESQQIQNL